MSRHAVGHAFRAGVRDKMDLRRKARDERKIQEHNVRPVHPLATFDFAILP